VHTLPQLRGSLLRQPEAGCSLPISPCATLATPNNPNFTGGAWIIGYKAWGALLAKRLSLAGAVVCCLDYRNFPQVQDAKPCRRTLQLIWVQIPVARSEQSLGQRLAR
jgi:hypothetical protein